MRHPFSLSVALLAFIAGCGSTAHPQTIATVSSPMTAQDEAVFEDGLDMVRDPRVLEGPWLTSWEDELDQRVTRADIVALVTVRTLRTDSIWTGAGPTGSCRTWTG